MRHQRRRTNCEQTVKLGYSSFTRTLPHSLKLKSLHRFTSTVTAVEEITAIQEGKLSKGLKKFLTDEIVEKGKVKEALVISDPKLGA